MIRSPPFPTGLIKTNNASCAVTLSTSGDKTAPIIELVPEMSTTIYLGDAISYKQYVTYSDDLTPTEKLKLSVDRSTVDQEKPGTYTVTYTAAGAFVSCVAAA